MNLKYKIGSIVKNNTNISFVIVDIEKDKKPNKYKVKSLESGFVSVISRSALYSGKYTDKLSPTRSGIASVGYASNYSSKEYSLWQGMIDRCYNKKHESYKYYGEKGVSVCKRWHRFDYFLEDISKIEGYSKEDFEAGLLELDKDIKQNNIINKTYSLEGCIFTSKQTNSTNTSRNREFYVLKPTKEIECHTVVKYYAKEHDLDDSCIHKCLKGKRKPYHKGHYFSYNEEDVKQERLRTTIENTTIKVGSE